MNNHLEKTNMQINNTYYSTIKAILPYLGFALIVFIAKLILIDNYGNATPFVDQWAEAHELFLPFFEGKLTWNDLLRGHNEHRIFTTRLLDLALLKINGNVWNPILQMQVNAVIHVVALLVLQNYISKALSLNQRNALLAFCAVIFAFPFGWSNTLEGFQSQFYFLLLFSFLFLWSMSAYKTYSNRWWLGVIAGILCILSLASGPITLIAGTIILSFRLYINKDNDEIAISAILLLLLIATIAIIFTPVLPATSVLNTFKATSITQFLYALFYVLAWPDTKFGIGIAIIHVPVLLLSFYIWRDSNFQSTSILFIGAVTLWLFGQFISIAYGRANNVKAVHYLDLFAIGLIVNFAALAILFNNANKYRLIFSGLWGLWIATVLFSFAISAEQIKINLNQRFRMSLEQEKNVRAYLCTQDFSYLENKPKGHIPSPNIPGLRNLLNKKTVRSFLPGNIYGPNSSNPETFCNEYKNEKPLHSLNVTIAKTCIGSIDTINNKILPKQFAISDTLNISGWLAQSSMKVLPAAKSALVVLTDSTGKNLFFRTQKHRRPSVAAHYKNPALSATGFETTINVSTMAGNYTLGLGFVEGENIRICPQFKIPGTIVKK